MSGLDVAGLRAGQHVTPDRSASRGKRRDALPTMQRRECLTSGLRAGQHLRRGYLDYSVTSCVAVSDVGDAVLSGGESADAATELDAGAGVEPALEDE